MKLLTKARKLLEKHLMVNYPVFEGIYYDDNSSGYILNNISIDKQYFKIILNDTDTKAKVIFQFCPIDPLVFDL